MPTGPNQEKHPADSVDGPTHTSKRQVMEFVCDKMGKRIDLFFGSKLVRGGFLMEYEVFESPTYFYAHPQDALRYDVERVAQDFWGAVKEHNEQLVPSG